MDEPGELLPVQAPVQEEHMCMVDGAVGAEGQERQWALQESHGLLRGQAWVCPPSDRQVEAQECNRRRSHKVGEGQGQGRAAEQGPSGAAGGGVAGSGGDAAVAGAAGGLGDQVRADGRRQVRGRRNAVNALPFCSLARPARCSGVSQLGDMQVPVGQQQQQLGSIVWPSQEQRQQQQQGQQQQQQASEGQDRDERRPDAMHDIEGVQAQGCHQVEGVAAGPGGTGQDLNGTKTQNSMCD